MESLLTKLGNTMSTYKNWFTENNLSLNIKKTKLLKFGNIEDILVTVEGEDLTENNLSLNIKKTKLLKFGNIEDILVTVEGEDLDCSDQATFLGITIDSDLNCRSLGLF
ncbi:hypothetical protein QE152_g35284 [Popillia japonica]|uniref:Uncharacterized protein n=1 Tax=Popillia japonica TaxID=7064 RepID=A0AAW1IFR6_POPJA